MALQGTTEKNWPTPLPDHQPDNLPTAPTASPEAADVFRQVLNQANNAGASVGDNKSPTVQTMLAGTDGTAAPLPPDRCPTAVTEQATDSFFPVGAKIITPNLNPGLDGNSLHKIPSQIPEKENKNDLFALVSQISRKSSLNASSGLSEDQSEAEEIIPEPRLVEKSLPEVPLHTSGTLPGENKQVAQIVATPKTAPPQAGICGEIVEQILVSRPTAGNQSEVRIKLDGNWLPDTEVRLLSQDNHLSVEFISDNLEAQRFLLPNLSNLQQRLHDRINGNVAVRLLENATTASHNANADTNEGRSRNQRNLYEEISYQEK